MATTTINYGTSTALTCTLAALATSATAVVGRESNSIDNTTTKAVDYLISVLTMTGTSPTGGAIEVWGAWSEDGTNYDGIQTGSDAAMTHTVETKASLKLMHIQPVTTTSNKAYRFSFHLQMPPGRKMNFFITHNTGVNLHATGGNHAITYTAIKYDSA